MEATVIKLIIVAVVIWWMNHPVRKYRSRSSPSFGMAAAHCWKTTK